MADDNNSILDLLSEHYSKKAKSSSAKEKKIEKCEIDEFVKRKQREEKYKKTPISKWANIDFLRFLDNALKVYGTKRVFQNARTDSQHMAKLYDSLAQFLQKKMSNQILKEYLEWWTNLYADRLGEKELYLANLYDPKYVGKYLLRFADEQIHTVIPKTNQDKISDVQMYDLGGLPILLVKRGIVVASQFIQSTGDRNWRIAVENALSGMGKGILETVGQATLSNGPYRGEPIDFVSIAKISFEKNGVETFKNVMFRQSFV